MTENSGESISDASIEGDFPRKTANLESHWLRITLSSIGDAVVATDSHGGIAFVNPVAEQLLECKCDDVLGKPLNDVIAMVEEDTREPAEDLVAKVRQKRVVVSMPSQKLLITTSGNERIVETNAAPILDNDGNILGVVVVFRDVTERRRAHEAQALLASIVAASDDAMVSKTLDGTILSWNKGAERLFGYTPEEAIGQSIGLIVPSELWDQELEILGKISRGEHIQHFETERVAKDGRRLSISLTVSPLTNSKGRVIGASKVARDITERKRAEEALRESEERFRMLADNISHFAWIADAKGWIFWYNQRWYDYTGTTLEEMQGWGWKKAHHPEHVDRVVERIQESWDTGKTWEDLFPLRGKNGKYRWFLSRAIPIRDAQGKVIRWFGTNTDVTEQRQAEEALREADRRKDEFVAMLAHELRNPLAPIRSGLDLLSMEDTSHSDIIELMQDQVKHLSRLVNELLDVSRIRQGKIVIRKCPVQLRQVLERSKKTIQSVHGVDDETFRFDLPNQDIWLDADPTRMAQVFENLFSNAIKYTETDATITVAVEQLNGYAVITVSDTGIGIDPKLLPNIFDLFTQSNRTIDRAQGGLGIGLTLVKQLVALHGGTISVQSEGENRGTQFLLRLPTSAPPDKPVERTEQRKTSKRALNILIVDDNRTALVILSRLLRKLGPHNVVMAHDGTEALAAFANLEPDLCILDIGLPGMDGYEVAQQMREHSRSKRLKLAALTGYGQREDRAKSKKAGFDYHIVKPASLDALVEVLDSVPSDDDSPVAND